MFVYIGLEEEKRSLSQRVEFLDTASAAPLNEYVFLGLVRVSWNILFIFFFLINRQANTIFGRYQFGFCAPEPQPTTCPNMNAAPSVQEPSFPRSASTQQPQPPAHIQVSYLLSISIALISNC